MITQLITATACLGLYLVLVARSVGIARPDSIFVTLHTLSLWGTLPHLNQANPTHVLYADLLLSCTVLTMAASAVTHLIAKTPNKPNLHIDTSVSLRGGARFVLLVGMTIVVIYYVSVGYSALLTGLQSSLSGTQNEVANMRLESYAGSRYLFPGYVNQFRNALVPMLVVLFIMQWRHSGLSRKFATVVLVTFAAFSLLGTAQRAAAVIFLVAVLVVLWQIDPRKAKRQSILVLAFALPLLALSTFALGREEQTGDSVASTFFNLTLQLAERGLGGSSEVEVRGFEYIASVPVANGHEWWVSLVGLLPGQTGSRLPNIIFAITRGSDRGNAQPTLWGSAYHNFGFSGALMLALLMGIFLALVTRSFNKRNVLNLYEIGGIAGITVTLGTWTVGSPVVPLNQGLPAYLALWLVGSILGRRSGRRKDQEVRASCPETTTATTG